MALTVLCAGTATEVGKTWVGAHVLTALREQGATVAARKPVQSFDPAEPTPKDAALLAEATGQPVDDVCPPHRSYEAPLAPPIAAALLGRPTFTLSDLAAEHSTPDVDVVWVETVGGPRSPIADDGDSADLVRWLSPDVIVLVADARLGAINAVRVSAIPFAGRPLLVYLNHYEDTDVCRTNRKWLTMDGYRMVTDIAELAQQLRPVR